VQDKENFRQYISAFAKKLQIIVPDDISKELYCKTYLSHLLQHKIYYLAIYADLLSKLLKHSVKIKSSVSLIDFGAGNGLLGLFAKFCGFNRVFINDNNADFLAASKNLALQLNINIDGFIEGDIDKVQEYFTNEVPDAIVGTDVIEHIYNLEFFFKVLMQMNPEMNSAFTTASNPGNYFKVKKLKKLQLIDEFRGGTPGDMSITGESQAEPFIKTREQIIRKHTSSLTDDAILELAKTTRGKNEQDIIAAINKYNISGELPASPRHETNTCNPLTGSWTERILPLDEYISIYNGAGFHPRFYNGFYNDFEGGIKSYAKKLLNLSIPVLGNKIAPYIIIVS
jgi:2-polyprenyl-3-methyl-5-hydroxy-6-metoxy-1,4-benzoquinol methylase